MNKKDIKDTIECREKLIEYLTYLESEEKTIEDELLIHTVKTIFTEASVSAYQTGMANATKKLEKQILNEEITEDNAAEYFNKTKYLFFKHCILMEIKHKHTKADSIKINPSFSTHIIEFI